MRALMFSIILATSCSKSAPDQPQGGPGGGQMPPAEVTVVTVKQERIALETELPGRTTAALSSEVRPQITGIVKARTFTEGAHVKQGQVLYQIDPAQYRAALAGAQADLANAKAQLESAKIRDDRYASLIKIEGVSKQEADDARLAHASASAAVAQKQAVLDLARINLDYTAIKAPITGRIGTSSVTAGALVTANQPQALATIRSLDPIYVDLTESNEARLRLREALGAGKLEAGSTAGQARARRWLAVSAGGPARVLRGRGRRGHRHGHAARHVSEPRRDPAPRHVRPRAAVPGGRRRKRSSRRSRASPTTPRATRPRWWSGPTARSSFARWSPIARSATAGSSRAGSGPATS